MTDEEYKEECRLGRLGDWADYQEKITDSILGILAEEKDEKLPMSILFQRLGGGRRRSREYGNWKGLPEPVDQWQWLEDLGFTVKKEGRARIVSV